MPFYGTPTSNFQQWSVACLAAALPPACLSALLARRESAPVEVGKEGDRHRRHLLGAPKILSAPRELKEATLRWSSPRTASQREAAPIPSAADEHKSLQNWIL